MTEHSHRDRPGDGAVRFFGRRQGRRLRPARQRLIESHLPLIRVSLPEAGRSLDPRALFGAGIGEIWLEIGFGAGEHLAEQAMRNRAVGFIGCEVYLNGVAAFLPRLVAANLDNVRVFDDDARGLLQCLASASVARIFVLFPDPWPKARHRARRLIVPENLKEMARILRPGGELRIASDHLDYVRWSLEHITREAAFAWTARSAADWRVRPDDGFATRYEQKALARGSACTYLSFRRRADAAPDESRR